ncbi:MAG TPA: HAMP domain-containing sensor histidine kinase [Vicinamibacterales bacterium]|nr:HAMP domain-containing sensor histidine kinase [Vicinamibacterales bacterium]
MSRARRLPLGLIVPALLVGLVALLGTLQYRWLGKVSEAEREQLRRLLEQRAEEFAADFDGEISRLYGALQASPAAVAGNDWTAFAAGVDRWRSAARFPDIVRAVYLAEPAGSRRTIRQYDEKLRAFGPPADEWPAHLDPVRLQLLGSPPVLPRHPGGQPQVVAVTLTPILPEVPALVIPVSDVREPDIGSRDGGMPTRLRFQWPGAHVVVDLDDAVLRDIVLPTLVTRHLPDQGAGGYRVAVLSAAGEQILVRGAGREGGVDPARADIVTHFFTLRLDVLGGLPGRGTVTFRAGVSGGDEGAARPAPGNNQRFAVVVEHRESVDAKGSASPAGQVRMLRAPTWRLVLQHAAGSLDAAVSQARRRNLWLGFGILSVLAGGVVLVVVNARRSGQLAARQMDFVATVSHELRTPLAVIRSAAQNLSAGVVSDPAQARRYGDLIEDEGRRLTDMVEEILEYSRIHGDRPLRTPRPLEIGALFDDLARSCGPACEEAGLTLEIAPPAPDVPVVVGDEAALRRALGNLVTNAVKHAAEGGWIRVEARVDTRRGRQEVRIDVSDRGPGIPPADLAHLFEPFYRGRRAVDRQVHGNGLGLSLVKRVAEAHRGSVSVTSAMGEGSVFTLRLPASTSVPAAAGPADATGAPLDAVSSVEPQP